MEFCDVHKPSGYRRKHSLAPKYHSEMDLLTLQHLSKIEMTPKVKNLQFIFNSILFHGLKSAGYKVSVSNTFYYNVNKEVSPEFLENLKDEVVDAVSMLYQNDFRGLARDVSLLIKMVSISDISGKLDDVGNIAKSLLQHVQVLAWKYL